MPLRLPQGVAVAPAAFGVDEALLGSRVSSFSFELLDNDENLLGALQAVDPGSGSVKWNAYASVKSGGQIKVTDIGADIDWLNVRIRPVAVTGSVNIDGSDLRTPLGLYIPAAPVEDWTSFGRSWSVEMLDKTSLLDTDVASGDAATDVLGSGRVPFALAAGANVIEAVKLIITDAGESAEAIEPDDKTLTSPMMWELGSTRLKVINDLLDLAGYFSIYADGAGRFRCDKYVRPEDRIPAYEALNPFSTGETSLMSPDWTRDRDIYAVPNRYVLTSQGDGTNPGLSSVATNVDPNSEFSFPRRGRWITAVETGVEALDQLVLDAMADRRLRDATSVTQTLAITHAFLPDLAVNKVIKFSNPGAAMEYVRVSVSELEVPLDETALCKSTLRVVAQS